jgi:hypothetical protein
MYAIRPASSLALKVHIHQMLFHNSHKLRNKSLQMENDLRTHPNPVLVKRRPLNHIRFQRIIDLRYKLERQSFENSRRRNAMCEEVVELGSHLKDSCRGVLFHDLLCDLTDQGFPVRGRNGSFVCDFLATTQYG